MGSIGILEGLGFLVIATINFLLLALVVVAGIRIYKYFEKKGLFK